MRIYRHDDSTVFQSEMHRMTQVCNTILKNHFYWNYAVSIKFIKTTNQTKQLWLPTKPLVKRVTTRWHYGEGFRHCSQIHWNQQFWHFFGFHLVLHQTYALFSAPTKPCFSHIMLDDKPMKRDILPPTVWGGFIMDDVRLDREKLTRGAVIIWQRSGLLKGIHLVFLTLRRWNENLHLK